MWWSRMTSSAMTSHGDKMVSRTRTSASAVRSAWLRGGNREGGRKCCRPCHWKASLLLAQLIVNPWPLKDQLFDPPPSEAMVADRKPPGFLWKSDWHQLNPAKRKTTLRVVFVCRLGVLKVDLFSLDQQGVKSSLNSEKTHSISWLNQHIFKSDYIFKRWIALLIRSI